MSYKDVVYDTTKTAYVVGFGVTPKDDQVKFTAPFSAFWIDPKRQTNPYAYEPINPETPELIKKSNEGLEVWEDYWEDVQDVIALRVEAYGSSKDQMEYITEKGLEAWQARVEEIKTQYPKPSMPE